MKIETPVKNQPEGVDNMCRITSGEIVRMEKKDFHDSEEMYVYLD